MTQGSAGGRRLTARLRADAGPIEALCLAVRDAHSTLHASLQSWPVALETDGAIRPLVLIGPVAVEPALQGAGLGRALMGELCARLSRPAVLVGDESYYGRWGFTAAPTRRWQVAGDVERDRLLARGCGAGLPVEGRLKAGREA